ncbi:MAG: hypothetical protein WDM79_12040 [Terricaulis sp.]
MLKWIGIALVAALIALGVYAAFNIKGTYSFAAFPAFAVGICQSNGEIAASERAAMEAAAVAYMDAFVADPIAAREGMSRAGKAATEARAPLEAAAAQYRNFEITTPRAASGAYLLRFSGGRAGELAPCGMSGGRAAFAARSGAWRTGVVLLTDASRGDTERTTSVWMEHEDGAWRVRGVHFAVSQICGDDAAALWEAAKEQRARGHELNAGMLYVAARGTLQRGAFFQDRLWQDFAADEATFVAPTYLQGPMPLTLPLGGRNYSVTALQYTGVGDGDVVLVIQYAAGAWQSTDQANAMNHALIDAFNAAYPEWRETFDAVVARAQNADGTTTFGTVYTKDRGYL